MKKQFFTLLSCLLLFIACTDVLEEGSLMPVTEKAQIRSYEDAMKIAESAMTMLDNNASRSAAIRKIADTGKAQCVINNKRSRALSSFQSDTLMYVFNFEDDLGFAVISANPKTQAVIAVTESGHYNPDSLSENEGFNYYMDLARMYVAYGNGDRIPSDSLDYSVGVEEESSLGHYVYHGNSIPVAWGQGGLEGNFCPNQTAGCGPVAMAQIMAYYQKPDSIYLSYLNEPQYSDEPSYMRLDWSDILKHTYDHRLNNLLESLPPCTASADAHTAISHLCRQIGKTANSKYLTLSPTVKITNTTGTATISTLAYYGYTTTDSWLNYNPSFIFRVLDDDAKIIMVGHCDEGNHCWIIDQYVNKCIDCYFLGELQHNIMAQYFHINWGWYGLANGYFAKDVFNTSDASKLDLPAPTPNYEFADSLGILPVKY